MTRRIVKNTPGPPSASSSSSSSSSSTEQRQDVLVVGAACSEIFCGPEFARVVARGLKGEKESIGRIAAGEPSAPLFIHTSAGIPDTLHAFIGTLEQHQPWGAELGEDWFATFQLEGASAVLAAIDLCIQLQQAKGEGRRLRVGVGRRSYHGPGSTSPGGPASAPSWSPAAAYQDAYPVPSPDARLRGEDDEAFHARLLREFDAFLDCKAEDLAVLLVEPQWGSSVAATPWPPALLREVVRRAQARGVLVVADEIMCGLGRHGQGTTFLSEAWDIRPDAVTFGKAISAGVAPLSGVVFRTGGDALRLDGKKVMQMHTYAGSSRRGFVTASDVLASLPRWHGHIAECGALCREAFKEVEAQSRGWLTVNGQGLMWGGMFPLWLPAAERAEAAGHFQRLCAAAGVLPYTVPVGFMFTPPYNITRDECREAIAKLAACAGETARTMGWHERDVVAEAAAAAPVTPPAAPPVAPPSAVQGADSTGLPWPGPRVALPTTAAAATAAAATSRDPRFKGPALDAMTAAQREIHDDIVATRTTGIRGPFGPWLANPDVARPAQELGRVCRYETSLELRESELAILLTAAYHDCPTEWAIHVEEARRAGLEEAVIVAIAKGGGGPAPVSPTTTATTLAAEDLEGTVSGSPRDLAIVDFVTQLLRHTRVPQHVYDRAVEELGEAGVVDLTAAST